MENEEQIKQIELFLNEVIVQELGKLQEAGLSYMQFVLMGQAIEVLGGFLDHKPMKAKGQSAHRFTQGVNVLFGGKYRLLNDRFFLYDKLRNQMTHTFIPSGDLLLLNREDPSGEFRHLEYKDGQLVLIGEIFYQDICSACTRLIHCLKDGRIKPKNIAF
ncbi:MAG: hypothetical protein RR397_08570 [Odoribacter sp.]